MKPEFDYLEEHKKLLNEIKNEGVDEYYRPWLSYRTKNV
jgi:hypothetical protein